MQKLLLFSNKGSLNKLKLQVCKTFPIKVRPPTFSCLTLNETIIVSQASCWLLSALVIGNGWRCSHRNPLGWRKLFYSYTYKMFCSLTTSTQCVDSYNFYLSPCNKINKIDKNRSCKAIHVSFRPFFFFFFFYLMVVDHRQIFKDPFSPFMFSSNSFQI